MRASHHAKRLNLACYVLAFVSSANNLSARVRSLKDNLLGGYYDGEANEFVSDMSGILKLAEALPHSQLTSLRSAKTPSNFTSALWHRPSAASNACVCLFTAVQPRGQPPLYRGLQGGRGCARQDQNHVSEVRASPTPPSLNHAWTLWLCACLCVSSQ